MAKKKSDRNQKQVHIHAADLQGHCTGSEDGRHEIDRHSVQSGGGSEDDDVIWVMVACKHCDVCGDAPIRRAEVAWDE